MTQWLELHRGDAPLILSMPHTGTTLGEFEPHYVSPWLARKDADWYIERLYAFGKDMGATVIRTAMSRSGSDVNRDPSGVSLYPGQATTELCPTTTFDGEPLYRDNRVPTGNDIAARRERFFDPYHATIKAEVERVRSKHGRAVLYDCHSIRSAIPRLFEGELPQFNIGTNGGVTCDPKLAATIESICAASGHTYILNGRFKGGFITRNYGNPKSGVHAVQMELACRGYMRERTGPVAEGAWPPAYDEDFAAPLRAHLKRILEACLEFAVHR